VSLLHVPYHNPQSDDYTTDFRVINGVNIDNSKYIALLDTGSNVSLIHSNIFRKLHPSVYEILPMQHSRTASLANGNTMTFSRLVKLKLTIQGRTVLLEAFVSPDITYELIIGTNFILQNNININFYTKTLNFVHTARLRMAHNITIQPYSIATVYTVLPKMPPGEQVMFTPSEHWIHQGIIIPKILFAANSNKPYAPIKISNIADKTIKLRMGRVMGVLTLLFCFEHPVGPLLSDPPLDKEIFFYYNITSNLLNFVARNS
jgi:hypothetical protein